MKFIKEIKNRLFLITLNFILSFSISYYYKNILFFLLLKPIAINQDISFYLIYTNISELFNIYFQLVYLIAINFNLPYAFYHLLIFVNGALYRNEYKLINLFFLSFIITNLAISFLIVILLYPNLWDLFQYFQKDFTFGLLNFETKISEYYETFLNLLSFCKNTTFALIFNFMMLKHYIKKINVIKFRKINLLMLVLILQEINDLFIELLLFSFIGFSYEFFIFSVVYFNIKQINSA